MAILKTLGAGPEVGKLFLAMGLRVAGAYLTQAPPLRTVGARELAQAEQSADIFCAQDVRQCPDGTYRARNPQNNCQFFSCVRDPLVTSGGLTGK